MWLQIKNEAYGLQNTALIGFSEITTAGLDEAFDSRGVATALGLFSHLEDGSEHLGIQSRESFNNDIIVPVGFSTIVDETVEYSILLQKIEGDALEGTDIFLIDTFTNEVTNITNGAYHFEASSGTYNARFILQFVARNQGVENASTSEFVMYPNPASDQLILTSVNGLINTISIFDSFGKVIVQENSNLETTQIINVSNFRSGIYFVEINNIETKKLIIK